MAIICLNWEWIIFGVSKIPTKAATVHKSPFLLTYVFYQSDVYCVVSATKRAFERTAIL